MSVGDAPTLDYARLDADGDTSLRGEMRRIFALAVPNIGTTVSRMLMGFTDFVMVSRLGKDALAAISPATILVWSVLCLGNGVASAVTTFSAQSLGRGNRREAAAYGWQSFYLALAFGIVMWPATWLIPDLIRWIGHPPAVMAIEIAYVRIDLWSVAPSLLVAGLDGFFNGIQRPGVSVWAVVASLISNAVLNVIFIWGFFGFPAMGAAGSALATVLSWCLRALILVMAFLSTEFADKFHTREMWRISWSKLVGLFRVGGPSSIQWFLDIAAWAVFMSYLVAGYGEAAMAATNVAVQYMHLSFMPAVGIGMALTSLVGHAIGRGKPEIAARRATAAMLMTCAYMGAIGLLFWLARAPLMRLMSPDAEVIALGGIALIWAAVFQIFDGLGITYSSALRGAGDTRWPAGAFLVCCWGIFVAGGWLVSRRAPALGFNGPWLMCTIYIAVLGVLLWWRFERGPWRKIKLFATVDNAAQNEIAAESLGAPG